MVIVEIILGVSSSFNIGLKLIKKLLKQNEQLEDDLVGTINGVVQTITDTCNQRMEQADLRGSFESDDEVGTVFTRTKRYSKRLKRQI